MATRVIRVLAHDSYPTATIKAPGAAPTTLAAGATSDIPQTSAAMSSQAVSLCMSGTTAQRPKAGDADVINMQAPTWYIDTTLGKVIVWTGASWRDPLTGGVV